MPPVLFRTALVKFAGSRNNSFAWLASINPVLTMSNPPSPTSPEPLIVLWLVSVSVPLLSWPRMRANLSPLARSLSVRVPAPVSVAAPDTSRLVTLAVGLIAIVPVLSMVPVINVVELLSSNSDPVLSSAPCVVPSSVLLVETLVSITPPFCVASVPPSIVAPNRRTTLPAVVASIKPPALLNLTLSLVPRTKPPVLLACKVPVLTKPTPPCAVTAVPLPAGSTNNSNVWLALMRP